MLSQEPDRSDDARTAGQLLERLGRDEAALRQYARAWEAARGNPDLALSVARLHRSTGAPAESLVWYRRADIQRSRELEVEWALAEFEAGEYDSSAQHLSALLNQHPDDPNTLITAARVATARGDVANATRTLERLAGVRSLRPEEQRWLAWQYRLAGDSVSALELYEGLLDLSGSEYDEVLTYVGDLSAELGDTAGALRAYVEVQRIAPSPSVSVRIARLLAGAGRFAAALSVYEEHLASESPTGLRLELSRASMGARDFEQAVRWATEATQSEDERGLEADITLAEALYLNGARGESADLVATFPDAPPEDPEILELLGHLAAAKDEHLRAFRLFGEAIERDASNNGALRYWRGLSAAKRADYGRALQELDQARAANVVPGLERETRADIASATAPMGLLPLRVFADANGVSLTQGGVGWRLWPTQGLPLAGEMIGGRISQGDVSYRRTRVTARIDRALVTPKLAVNGELGVEDYESGGSLLLGRGGVSYQFEEESVVGIELQRDSLWSAHDSREPRRFNRVTDLRRLGPNFRIQRVRATLDKAAGEGRTLRVQGGRGLFEDGNRRSSVYAHYQVATTDVPGNWTALVPNVHWESFRDASPLYFSPDRYLSIGTMWHTIRSAADWRLDAEINPKLVLSRAEPGFGLHGVLDITRDVGPFTAGGGAFIVYDQHADYWLWRLAAQLGLRLR